MGQPRAAEVFKPEEARVNVLSLYRVKHVTARRSLSQALGRCNGFKMLLASDSNGGAD